MAISGVGVAAPSSATSIISTETIQSALVGGAVGAVAGAGMGGGLPWSAIGLITGAAAGAGVGLARGAVDAATGDGIMPALAQTGAGVAGGLAGGIAGMLLVSTLPGISEHALSGGGLGLFYVALIGAAAFGGALIAPPILDRLGILD